MSSFFVMAAAVAALFAMAGTAAAATGEIKGEVTNSATSIEGVEVCAFDQVEVCGMTGPDGKYALAGLPDGHYLVEFWAPSLGYLTQYFDGAASLEDADEVEVTGGGTVSGVDAELEEGAKIAGRVTDAVTGAGINDVEVCAVTVSAIGGCASTDPSGDYTLIGVPSGSWVVEFEALGYETRYYDEASSEGAATPVNVSAPNTAVGINARLSKPSSHVVLPHLPVPPVVSVPPVAAPKAKPKPKPHCKKGFKRVKKHGHTVCAKKHKKKHRS